MDTQLTPEQLKAKVQADLQRIKTHMPGVYKSIQQMAQKIGNQAYTLVRLACAGQPNTFFAIENGHVVGTRFGLPDLDRDIAVSMLEWGMDCLVVWPLEYAEQGSVNGPH